MPEIANLEMLPSEEVGLSAHPGCGFFTLVKTLCGASATQCRDTDYTHCDTDYTTPSGAETC